MRYLGNHRRSTFLAYFALIIASMAQLAVPQLTQNMINAITDGVFAKEVLDGAPPEVHENIAHAAGTTVEAMQRARDHASEWLHDAALIIVLFAFVRGVFSFIQTYMAENTSQGVAYDFRNAIYRKVQRLSFSYYDRTHTGQIMIRATDDVERLRIFLAQGLVLTAQSLILVLATLTILFLTNWQLTLVILPILPVALVLFGAFGAFVRPLFSELQRRLAILNTILQENLAGIRTIKGFRREKEQQARFQQSTDDLYAHQIRIASVFSTMFPLIFLVSQIGQGIILYFSGQQIFRGALTWVVTRVSASTCFTSSSRWGSSASLFRSPRKLPPQQSASSRCWIRNPKCGIALTHANCQAPRVMCVWIKSPFLISAKANRCYKT